MKTEAEQATNQSEHHTRKHRNGEIPVIQKKTCNLSDRVTHNA